MKIEQKHFDAMMKGTKCRFWDIESKFQDIKNSETFIDILTKLDGNDPAPFFALKKGWFVNCEPLSTETYVKEWFEIAKQLHKDGYAPFEDDSFELKDKDTPWLNDMWKTCGKEYRLVNKYFNYLPEWLEEKEVKE